MVQRSLSAKTKILESLATAAKAREKTSTFGIEPSFTVVDSVPPLRQNVRLAARKTTSPAIVPTISPAKLMLFGMSLARTVPLSVPSVRHSCWPCASSKAKK
ncbi:MAG TPA: hypothetical protein VG323_14495 [Thermoanaerobaculia bacterium]|nr:hypothetical protein [Thermoanaerobaculia bacterium]